MVKHLYQIFHFDELHDDDRQESLADLYSSVRTASPLTNGHEMEVAGVSMDETSAFPVSLPLGSGGIHEPTTPSLSGSSAMDCSPTTSRCTSTPTSTKSCPCTPASQTGQAVTPRQSSSEGDLRFISKYLVQIVPSATPNRPQQSAKHISGARVLTSAKCAALLQKREENKRKSRKAERGKRMRKKQPKEG